MLCQHVHHAAEVILSVRPFEEADQIVRGDDTISLGRVIPLYRDSAIGVIIGLAENLELGLLPLGGNAMDRYVSDTNKIAESLLPTIIATLAISELSNRQERRIGELRSNVSWRQVQTQLLSPKNLRGLGVIAVTKEPDSQVSPCAVHYRPLCSYPD